MVAPTGSTVLLDGEPLPAPSFEPVHEGRTSVARLAVAAGFHHLTAAVDGRRVGMAATLYGFARYVSYGLSAGQLLAPLHRCGGDDECPVEARCCTEGADCPAALLGGCVLE